MIDEKLIRLAKAHKVATEFSGYNGQRCEVSQSTLRKILQALGVPASTEAEVDAALTQVDWGNWQEVVPPTVVVDYGQEYWLPVHVPHGSAVKVSLTLENGDTWDIRQLDVWKEPRQLKDRLVGEATFEIPSNIPIGWHELTVSGEAIESTKSTLIIVPTRLEFPKLSRGRAWGIQAQLYSVRSTRSWGIGDARDLQDIVAIAKKQGADFVLINPLHAGESDVPLTPSPYLPSSRRFVNPIYIRPQSIEEFQYMDPSASMKFAGIAQKAASYNKDANWLDRDEVWRLKRQALEIVFQVKRSPSRQMDFENFCSTQGKDLENFALWCAITRKFNGKIPEEYQQVDSVATRAAAKELANEVEFFKWLQWVVDEQLEAVKLQVKRSGMSIGVCADLAVGVHSQGADKWTTSQAFASGISVGAPPDMYSQKGQDWSPPPWSPRALERLGYAPLRDMLRTVLRHAGALRIDHVMGLFRLWWIPLGATPGEGTYVYYDHHAMVGIVILEAMRAGAVVVGEDLGVVEPWMREYLHSRGILGTSVLWFEQEHDGTPRAPQNYRRSVLATVNTHDLPPVAGYLAGDHVEIRHRLGIIVDAVSEVRAKAQAEIDNFMSYLESNSLITPGCSLTEKVAGLHRLICQTPAALVGMSLSDAVGERRIQNQPGTDREYPNWCIPLADSTESVVIIDQLEENLTFKRLCKIVEESL